MSLTPSPSQLPSPSPSPANPHHRGAKADKETSEYEEDPSSSYLYEDDRGTDDEEYDDYEDDSTQEEALLTFSQFTLDAVLARDHHRIVAYQCFPHFIAVGTNQGVVFLFSYDQASEGPASLPQGSVSSTATNTEEQAPEKPHAPLLRMLHHHTEPVHDLSCSSDDKYMGSVDKTGMIVIQNLTDEGDTWTRLYEAPVSSIALHPLYSSHDEKPFLCATGEKVLCFTRSSLMLGHRRSVVLSDHHGKVQKVRWCHTTFDLAAWLTERGVCVYDMAMKQLLRFVPRPTQGTIPLPALYPSSMTWDTMAAPSLYTSASTTTTVLCWGWADWAQEVRLCLSQPHPATAAVPHTSTSGRWLVQVQPPLLPSATTTPPPHDSDTHTLPQPDRHLYPDRGGEAAASERSGGEQGELAMRVCGLMPFGQDCYVVLAAMVDPKAEATVADLEIRVVARSDFSPLYRGRLLVPLAHPLQLSLAGIDNSHHTGCCRGTNSRQASPYTSTRTSSLAATAGLHNESSPFPQKQKDRSSATPTPAPSASRTTSGLVSPGGPSNLAGISSSVSPTRSPQHTPLAPAALPCHHTGLTEQERLEVVRARYQDPTRVHTFPPDGAAYWVVSLNTILRAVPADLDSHISYLISLDALREAYDYAKPRQDLLQHHSLKSIGYQLVAQMLEDVDEQARLDEQPPHAARPHLSATSSSLGAVAPAATITDLVALLPEVLQDDCAEWERWIYILDQRGESWRMAPCVPTSLVPGATTSRSAKDNTVASTAESGVRRIGASYYDLLLLRLVERDPVQFNETLRRFEGLYNAEVVLKPLEVRYKMAVSEALACGPRASLTRVETALDMDADTQDSSTRRASSTDDGSRANLSTTTTAAALTEQESRMYAIGEAYGRLLRHVGRDEEALEVLLRVEGSRELFTFIRARALFAKALEMLPGLFARSAERTVKLLLEHATPPPPPQALSASASSASTNVAHDPLRPEEVVKRLQSSDRRYLWQYLVALRQTHPDVFTGIAKRHAQLIATLYMDYSPHDLLAFLKEMSMYLDKMKEIYALCKKNQLVEEMLFIMARLGKEEEGVRVIVEQQKNVRKAIDFVLSIPSRSEQQTLFRRLVDMTVAAQENLAPYRAQSTSTHGSTSARSRGSTKEGDEANGGGSDAKSNNNNSKNRNASANDRCDQDNGDEQAAQAASPCVPMVPPFSPKRVSASELGYSRCFAYTPRQDETLGLVATRFDVPLEVILEANAIQADRSCCDDALHASADATTAVTLASRRVAPSPCVVPVNLVASLLITVADPAYADNPAVDLRYVLARLPEDEPLPGAAACVAAVLHSRGAAVNFQDTVLSVTEADLCNCYGHLLKRRTAAVRMNPAELCCAYCGQRDMSSFLPRTSDQGRAARCRQALAEGREMPSLTRQPIATSAVGAVHGLALHAVVDPLGKTGAIVFPCHHAYHPVCLIQSLAADGCLRDGVSSAAVDVQEFLQRPERYAAPRLNRVLPYCRLCTQLSGAASQ